MYITIDAKCPKCDAVGDLLLLVPTDRLPPSMGDVVPHSLCQNCQVPVIRIPSAPNKTKASFVDGTKRFSKLREEAALDNVLSETQVTGDRVKIAHEKLKLSEKKT
jgi:hypothetical protein